MTDIEKDVLQEMLERRKKELASCERMLELLQPEWDKFEARTGHDVYVARDYADHFSAARTHRKEIAALGAAIAAMQPAPQWQGIESAPRDGTKAILYFPQYATDFDGVDYSYSLAIYRKNSTFPLGTWCDQGTNHDSFEGPDMTGCDKASHWMPLPTPPAGGSDAE